MIRPLILTLVALLAPAQTGSSDGISAASLRGRVSFLASDALEGRDSPSHGLELAAEYIVSEFRRAGLESPPGLDFSQEAPFLRVVDASNTLRFSIASAGQSPRFIPPEKLAGASNRAVHLVNEPVYKWAPGVNINRSLAGMVLMLRAPAERSLVGTLALSRPDCIVQLMRKTPDAHARAPRLTAMDRKDESAPVMVRAAEADLESVFDRMPPGLTGARVSVEMDAPVFETVRLRNLVAVLRGSDPKLCDEYIVLSAHYDHLGVATTAKNGVFHGANDNASGVASLLEVAGALAQSNPRPRRSVVFLCFFGEEKGLVGSTWYVRHPLFPLARTVMDINLEQLGLPDRAGGLPPESLAVTGYSFTDAPQMLQPAFKQAEVTLEDAPSNVEFFERSDNLPFARAGVPAHTLAAAFTFPDYHRVSDEWPKLDYENLAILSRGLLLALRSLASTAEAPQWNGQNKRTQEYRKAWRTLHP